jgi:hypothetical protein
VQDILIRYKRMSLPFEQIPSGLSAPLIVGNIVTYEACHNSQACEFFPVQSTGAPILFYRALEGRIGGKRRFSGFPGAITCEKTPDPKRKTIGAGLRGREAACDSSLTTTETCASATWWTSVPSEIAPMGIIAAAMDGVVMDSTADALLSQYVMRLQSL